jgi:surface carbohydrate biosynthesis protein
VAIHIAVVVDNPLRDLPGCVLLAARLCAEGAICHLVPLHAQGRELPALAPDAAVLPYLRPNNERLAGLLTQHGTSVFVLDTEGGVLPDLETYDQTLSQQPFIRQAVRGVCTWGQVLAGHLVERGWYRKDQVFVTGSPRFDFYADPWSAAAKQTATLDLPNDQPVVLVNGNFPLANPQFQTPEEEVRNLVERMGFDRELIEGRQQRQAEAMRGLVEVSARLAAALPVAVVYRPHPFERIETYSSMLPERTNLHVRRHGTVDGWILQSVAVIQRSCTTAIEAALAGIPALETSWLPTAVTMPVAESVSIRCSSYEELEAFVERAITTKLEQDPATRAALDSVVTDWFHRVDGNAHRRVADVVLRGTPVRSPAARKAAFAGWTPRSAGPWQRLVAAGGRRLLPAEAARIKPGRRGSWRGDKFYDVDDVRRVTAALARAAGPTGEGGLPSISVSGPDGSDYVTWLPYRRAVRMEAR